MWCVRRRKVHASTCMWVSVFAWVVLNGLPLCPRPGSPPLSRELCARSLLYVSAHAHVC